MKAVLLAAGVGARLRPFTESTPKCLIPVAGKPVIERTIECLVAQGVSDLAVNLHYRPDIVRSVLGSGRRLSASIRYYHEPSLLGTAGAIRPMEEWLGGDDFLVVFADNIIEIEVRSLLRLHKKSRATVTVSLYRRAKVHASGVAEITPAGRVTKFIEKPAPGVTDSHWVNAGMLCCSPRLLHYIPEGPSDLGHDVLPSLLRAQEIVSGYQMTGDESLHWIDTPDDLRNTAAALSSRRNPQ